MARLYEYADSNDKSGYFLRGASEDSNYTMRATDLGKRLFDRLDYDPGIVNRERGPRIPAQLQWAMYEVGLLKTGDSDPSGAGFDGELDVEGAELTDDIIAELENFVWGENSDRDEIQEFADILDIEIDNPRTPIWEISESAAQSLTSVYETALAEYLCTEDAPELDVSVTFESELSRGDFLIFGVDVVPKSEEYKAHYYQISYRKEGENAVTTVTRDAVDLQERVRIDRQRGRILQAMSEVPHLVDYSIGNPGENLSLVTVEGDLEKNYETLS